MSDERRLPVDEERFSAATQVFMRELVKIPGGFELLASGPDTLARPLFEFANELLRDVATARDTR